MAAAGATALVFAVVDSEDVVFRASMATAYVALLLLAITLSFGPVAVLRGRGYPVSTDIRRDYGIWSAIVAVAHVVIGLQVHLRGKMWEYFVRAYSGVPLPRIDLFGFANYTGLAATILLLALLVTSNDYSLRRLSPRRWQRLHRLAYWALGLTLAHAVAYQITEKRALPFIAALVGISAAILGLRYAAREKPGRSG